jgi:hypothetical protein
MFWFWGNQLFISWLRYDYSRGLNLLLRFWNLLLLDLRSWVRCDIFSFTLFRSQIYRFNTLRLIILALLRSRLLYIKNSWNLKLLSSTCTSRTRLIHRQSLFGVRNRSHTDCRFQRFLFYFERNLQSVLITGVFVLNHSFLNNWLSSFELYLLGYSRNRLHCSTKMIRDALL